LNEINPNPQVQDLRPDRSQEVGERKHHSI